MVAGYARDTDVVEGGLDSRLLGRCLSRGVELGDQVRRGGVYAGPPERVEGKAVNAREDEIAVPATP